MAFKQSVFLTVIVPILCFSQDSFFIHAKSFDDRPQKGRSQSQQWKEPLRRARAIIQQNNSEQRAISSRAPKNRWAQKQQALIQDIRSAIVNGFYQELVSHKEALRKHLICKTYSGSRADVEKEYVLLAHAERDPATKLFFDLQHLDSAHAQRAYAELERLYRSGKIDIDLFQQASIIFAKKTKSVDLDQTKRASNAQLYTDLISSSPTNPDIFHQETIDPSRDYKAYLKQVNRNRSELFEKGLYTAGQALSLLNDFSQKTAHHVTNVVKHPGKYATEFVEGNVTLAKELGSLMIDIASVPDEWYPSEQEQKFFEQRVEQRMEKVDNFLNSLSQMDREAFLDVSSKLCADFILLKGAGIGINAFSKLPGKIKGSGFLETVESNLIKGFTEHPSLTTPEGFTIKAPQVFEETNVLRHDAQSTVFGSSALPKLQKEVSAVEHSFKYHERIRARALQDPIAHNFPYTFDDIILKSNPIVQNDGSLLFRHHGFLNGKEGFYEIALNKETHTIFHRSFVGKK